MNPFYLRLDRPILDVAALPQSEIALLTERGITIVDVDLKEVASIPFVGSAGMCNGIIPLPDGQFVVHQRGGLSRPQIGARGGSLMPLDEGPDAPFYDGVVGTSEGFIAVRRGQLLVDVKGMRTRVETGTGFFPKAVFAWNGGVLVTAREGWRTYDAHGAPGDEVDVPLGEVALFGYRLISTGDKVVTCFSADGEEQWKWEKDELLAPPQIIGKEIVIHAYTANKAWVLDAEGQLVREVELPNRPQTAASFGGEIVFACLDSRLIGSLEHDGQPGAVKSMPDGALATTDGDVLYVWRPGSDGPPAPPLNSSLPIGAPIVMGGSVLKIEGPGRFAMRATVGSRPIRVGVDEAFRPATTADEARAVVDRLIARGFKGPMPFTVDVSGEVYEQAARIAQRPLSESVELHGRALFAASTLNEATTTAAQSSRPYFFEELGAAFGMSARRVQAAVRARRFPLEPPRPMDGYEYLGMFTTTGKLAISDPCYLGRSTKVAFPITVETEAMMGNWHAFVKPVADNRVGELIAVHETGFDVVANENIGSIGVDSGMAGVFDRACPKPEQGVILDDGILGGLATVSSTGQGDGFYGVFAGKKALVAKIRIWFMGDTPAELDATVGKIATESKKYLATERYAVGDTIEHKKFGTGVVTRLATGDKIEVSFGGESRTLVHGLKV